MNTVWCSYGLSSLSEKLMGKNEEMFYLFIFRHVNNLLLTGAGLESKSGKFKSDCGICKADGLFGVAGKMRPRPRRAFNC